MKKTKLCLKTGLFEENKFLVEAIKSDLTIDLTKLDNDDEWDDAVEAILDHDLVISL